MSEPLPATAEVHFQGGPADGAIRRVAVDNDGRPAPLAALLADGVYVASSDAPAPASVAVYRLGGNTANSEPPWIYEHLGIAELLSP